MDEIQSSHEYRSDSFVRRTLQGLITCKFESPCWCVIFRRSVRRERSAVGELEDKEWKRKGLISSLACSYVFFFDLWKIWVWRRELLTQQPKQKHHAQLVPAQLYWNREKKIIHFWKFIPACKQDFKYLCFNTEILVGMCPVALSVRPFEAVLLCVFSQQERRMTSGPFCFLRICSLLRLYSSVVYWTALFLLSHYIVLISTCGMTTLSWIGKYLLVSAVIQFKLLPRHLRRTAEKYQEAFPTHMYNNRCFFQDHEYTLPEYSSQASPFCLPYLIFGPTDLHPLT